MRETGGERDQEWQHQRGKRRLGGGRETNRERNMSWEGRRQNREKEDYMVQIFFKKNHFMLFMLFIFKNNKIN